MLATLASLLLFFGNANAAAPSSCSTVKETKMGTYLQRTWYESSGICVVSVSPENAYVNLIYRDYALSTDGMFMVFNLYGSEGDFGVRDFFMFPRTTNVVTYQWKEDTKELLITHATGDVFTFDATQAKLKSISGATIKVTDEVTRNNRGGVEIKSYSGLLLDTGFTVNKDPTESRDTNSTIKKSSATCSIKNRNLFQYMSDGDIVFKYRNDKDFFSYLRSVCPGLL
ncbi:hypothetical protein [Bdellovibrio bacteriovorus]|uniref:hypothetical protein n=1 Tax=Bdellovibrio TaxID=958 RepID=UPI0035A8B954